MAFYSRSINSLESSRSSRPKTCVEFDSHCFLGNGDVSDRASTASRRTSSYGGVYSSFRNINPALCIQKSTTSMESLSDVLPSLVPPLDLNSSGETMPSTDSAPNVSFTIKKTCEENKISQSNAFYNWLSGKKRLKSFEEAKQKALEEEKKRQLEERKKLAQENYQKWLARKTAPKEKPMPQNTEMQEYQKVCQGSADSDSNRRAWEQKKLEEQRRKREQIQMARERQKRLEEQRKEQASRAWQNWIAEAPLKPKPVPLNKGFLTLKGTISDIYINPIPWQEPFEPCDSVECE